MSGELITVESLVQALPSKFKDMATQSLADKINAIGSNDPEMARGIRENYITFSSVLKDGRYTADDYLRAVTYVTCIIVGKSKTEAYHAAHPDRMNRMLADGRSPKDISAYVAAYHKGQLVTAMLEQAVVPLWLVNQGIAQQAVNQLAHLMMNASSEKVQGEAASALLTHLKQPEAKKVNLEIGIQENDSLKEMRAVTEQMAQQLQTMLQSGANLKDVAGGRIIEAKVLD